MSKNLSRMPSSKIINKLEEHLGMTFPEIVNKHFQQGMSRYDCTDLLNDLTGWKDSQGKGFFKQATIWNMVKAGIKFGIIENFDFTGRHKGNANYSNKKPVKKINSLVVRSKESDFPEEMNATYTCMICQNVHADVFKTHDENFVLTLVRAHKCPKCGQYASCSLEFDYNGIHARKAVILHEGSRREAFVDENLQWVENPFVHIHV